jgi:hypothetical protein
MEEASHRKVKADSSSIFINITSSLSQSVSSNMHPDMHSATISMPSSIPGNCGFKKPYNANLLKELRAALVNGPLVPLDTMTW